MKKLRVRAAAFFLAAALVFCLSSGVFAASEEADDASPDISFLSLEEALTYFDFDTAASNWCMNFGMDSATQLEEARNAIIAGTDPALIIGLATFARDTGHGGEKLVVSNAFRPAAYQEVIGLHDSNSNIGYYRKSMYWNDLSVTDFWWKCESARGWPDDYTIDWSDYDLDTLDLRYAYRAGLRLWDNTWSGNYYARPGCSAHNSGTAMDIQNWWIAANFDTSYTVNGVTYRMEDYGIYKPLQPSAVSNGETWHITSAPAVTALGNYDTAFLSGAEPVYGIYYNPTSRGWSMADGRGIYIGAGVMVIQLRLCQLGLLDEKYVTGFYCSKTEAAIKSFQQAHSLTADGICGSGTTDLLFADSTPVSSDTEAPVLVSAALTSQSPYTFTLTLSASDNERVSAFRVDTRGENSEVWVSRYYNAMKDGRGVTVVDVNAEGWYDVSVRAVDAAGNESEAQELSPVYADQSGPVLSALSITDISKEGFTLHCSSTDASGTDHWTLTLTSEDGDAEEFTFEDEGSETSYVCRPSGTGPFTITVAAEDILGNADGYAFVWTFDPAAADSFEGLTITHYQAVAAPEAEE